ncbi:hypothetical protein SAY86_028168 [Trapa natans]|uniref:Protein TIC 20 n=1 Tax=Trapa natans TaxID=22666 RepID=A0AAN7RAH4_TRANT|nr:hypothetical protein SAY86_028168 [Trapa natans]
MIAIRPVLACFMNKSPFEQKVFLACCVICVASLLQFLDWPINLESSKLLARVCKDLPFTMDPFSLSYCAAANQSKSSLLVPFPVSSPSSFIQQSLCLSTHPSLTPCTALEAPQVFPLPSTVEGLELRGRPRPNNLRSVTQFSPNPFCPPLRLSRASPSFNGFLVFLTLYFVVIRKPIQHAGLTMNQLPQSLTFLASYLCCLASNCQLNFMMNFDSTMFMFLLVCLIYNSSSCLLGQIPRLPLVAEAADRQVL